MKPSATVKGSRSAASMGGRTAFKEAMTSAMRSAPPYVSTETPGRMSAANQSATAVRSHESRSRDTLKRGRSGCQVSASA